MFRNDKSDDVKIKNIKGTISQMKKSKTKLIQKNSNYSKVPLFLITNVTDVNVIKSAKEDLRQDLRTFDIDIFTPNEFHEFVKNKL